MRYLWWAGLPLCLLTLCLTAEPVAAQGAAKRIVVFAEGCESPSVQADLVAGAGGEATRPLRLVRGMAALLTPAAERALLAQPEVRRVEPDVEVRALDQPIWSQGKRPAAQPAQQLPWGVDRIDAEWAWSVSRGAGVKVAVIDTGIDRTHPDLKANLAGGANFVAKNAAIAPDVGAWSDDNGHGSHVAGIIAAVDNEIGVVGVAPQASLYAVKVLNKNGTGYSSDVIAGIQWAVGNGMDLANMSLGSDIDSPALHDACDAAAAAGLILVAAAGNDGGSVDFPGAYGSVLAVAAVDKYGQVASWSSHGPEVDLAAPGVDVPSCWRNGGYATASGTSMAAPHVTGAIALKLSANPFTAADDLLTTGWDEYTGWGLVDAGEMATGIVNYGSN